jgi:Spy/CpxP family protein refolding chaperone
MKKITATLTAMALALAIGSTVQAGMHKGGMHGGCGDCAQSGTLTEQQRAFQMDTIDLRQEMMMKRFEVQRENLKATPDSARVTALQAEIKAIQTKIGEIHVKSGMPDCGLRDGECFKTGGKARDCGTPQPGGCNGPCGKK